MKILLVSSYLPYPLYSGGHIRLYNLIKQLSDKHEITLVCEKRSNQNAEDIAAVRKICKEVIAVPRKKQWTVRNIIKTGISTDPFLITGHKNNEMQKQIQTLLQKNSYDLIHVETFYVLQNIPKTTTPKVLVEHNVEYLVYKRYMQNAPFFLKPLLAIDVLKLKRKEEHAWKQAERLVAVSTDEKKIMDRSDTVVVPNGVDSQKFLFRKSEQKTYSSIAKGISIPEKELLFIGDFKWLQNRDTTRWIIKDIWPFLLRALEGEIKIRLRVVGRNIPQSIKDTNMFESIVFDENNSKETFEIFRQADVLLTPIRIGGGTSYKILEAMATGVPVVTTSLGAEGFGVHDGEEMVIADDVQTLVEKIARLLRDEEQYNRIAKSARTLIEEQFDWKIIAKKLDEVYKSLVRN